NSGNESRQTATDKGEYTFAWRAVGITLVLLFGILVMARLINRNASVNQNPPLATENSGQQVEQSTPSGNLDTQTHINEAAPQALATTENVLPQSNETDTLSSRIEQDRQQPANEPRLDTLPSRQTDNITNNTQNPRTLLNQYENRIREAIRNKNYAEAERILENLQRLAPNNERLNDYLDRVRNMRRQQ
ncbi:MAG: hypothetical protein HKN08_03670, partial [Gammaproteobacteria bacterium]|nr:hypothetical protein [Gammaproteobacteria bacterium]